jgi:putative glutathione S-transferase
MASTRDISQLSDISKLKTEEDGSFKRQTSQFRNFIKKGGDFEPEKGESWFLFPYEWVG